MIDTGIGRLLVASLHQGIADVVPTRLEFYEAWLNPAGLRDGRVGMAPMAAALSFLRREGDLYETVVTRAGEVTADWMYESLPRSLCRAIQAAPRPIRVRLALRVAGRMVRETYRSSRPTFRWRRDDGMLVIGSSIFCDVREPAGQPLCGYYAAAVRRLLERFDVSSGASVSACRATGGGTCEIRLRAGRGGADGEGRGSLLH